MMRGPAVHSLDDIAGLGGATTEWGTQIAWADAFGSDSVDAVLESHAAATSTPLQIAGTLLASRLVSGLARTQGRLLTEGAGALRLDPRSVWLERAGSGEINGRLASDSAQVVSAEADAVAGQTLDAFIHACVTDLSRPRRVSARVLASAAAFAWLAGIRAASGRMPEVVDHPADLLRDQWRSSQPLSKIVREVAVPSSGGAPVRFLVRRTCCLEYAREAPGERTYCPSCPLVPDKAVIARRARVLAGERPRDFDDRDRRAVAG